MRENPNAYLQAFTDFKMAEARYSAALRSYREQKQSGVAVQAEVHAAHQEYRERGARMLLVADRLGVKPIGGFAVPLGVG